MVTDRCTLCTTLSSNIELCHPLGPHRTCMLIAMLIVTALLLLLQLVESRMLLSLVSPFVNLVPQTQLLKSLAGSVGLACAGVAVLSGTACDDTSALTYRLRLLEIKNSWHTLHVTERDSGVRASFGHVTNIA
jgi:hypothetical protein